MKTVKLPGYSGLAGTFTMDTNTQPYVFDLDAGIPCLDFVNTLSSTSGEHLRGYADLVDFAHQSSLLTPTEAARLQ
ncbi:MAG TPA: ABATE domain-containing protein, partial [Chloroflexota bacterium]|nr:ABATE domain-containing protein [Chloroflexota bacterium]